MKRTLSVTNRRAVPRAVYVEPEGADYWLLPEQTFVLRAEVTGESGEFELWDDEDGLSVFPSVGMGTISVYANEQELECGHQRPHAV
jgi:hypothetical protein